MQLDYKNTPKIGIVIPIYNVAKYLRECINSVLNQSYQNFEVVLINDGSTDILEGESISQSLKIALEYVTKDSRFVLFDKENGGQSIARNVGISWFSGEIKTVSVLNKFSTSIAKFSCKNLIKDSTQIICYINTSRAKSILNPPKIDYIIFLDSDDFWENDLLEKCVESAQIKNNKTDIIWFDWTEIYEDNKIQGKTALELFGFTNFAQITAMQWLQRAKERKISKFWFSVMGLIRFDYIRSVNLYFFDGIIFEDNLFGVLLFLQCESIVIVPQRLYNYRIRKHSTTNNNTKSLPPFIAPLKKHFIADDKLWDYFCAYSLCEMSLTFADFCANLSDTNYAKLCKSTFLPNFLAESCDIFAFKDDPLNAKSRFVALLKKYRMDSPYLKIIANIMPRNLKRLRYLLYLLYFAPRLAIFRATCKILKTLRFYRG